MTDGNTMVLTDGRTVRLLGIRPHEQTTTTLGRLVVNRSVVLESDGSFDRHGRLLAHVFLDDGTWVQDTLLAAGLAMVQTLPDHEEHAAAMYATETIARAARLGLWSNLTTIRGSEDVGALAGTFQIIEGSVSRVYKTVDRLYITIGSDWREGLSVIIATPTQKAMKKAGLEPKQLRGCTIRVRGWLARYHQSAAITITHPTQIELVGNCQGSQ